MRRILVLLFLTLTAFQFAFAGMPTAVAAVQADSHCITRDAAVQAAAQQVPHGHAADQASASPCDTLQACSVCGACQLCHQATHPNVRVLVISPRAAGLVFPPTTTHYLSAECAPSFKPPIL